MKRLFCMAAACAVLIAPALAAAQALDFSGKPLTDKLPPGSKAGDPTAIMPAGQRLISSFGERPVFSPDGTKVAFIGKTYGDAFEYDLRTGAVRNLTSHMAHNGFLRVHYLNDGSILLLGPHVPAATWAETREKRIEVWWMDAAAAKPAVRLGVTLWEGLATSRLSNKIAWTRLNGQNTTLMTGDVVVSKGAAALANVQEIATTTECRTEAQDFLPGDKGLTMPCYNMGAMTAGAAGRPTEVVSIDFATKQITKYPTPPIYGEVEGMFPGGKRTLVECSGDRSAGMDLCVLDLTPTNPRYTRITHIMDYGRWKYGNPTVSPDGRTIAAQVGSADVSDVGAGQGIVLIDVPNSF